MIIFYRELGKLKQKFQDVYIYTLLYNFTQKCAHLHKLCKYTQKCVNLNRNV